MHPLGKQKKFNITKKKKMILGGVRSAKCPAVVRTDPHKENDPTKMPIALPSRKPDVSGICL